MLALPVAYHPVLRLTRSRVVESREWVCDATAAAAIGPPVVYARSLLRLATLLVQTSPVTASHAIGILDATAVEGRLMKLTRSFSQNSFPRRMVALTGCAVLAVTTCASAWALRTGVVLPSAQQEAGSSPQSVRIAPGVMAGNVIARVHPIYPEAAKAAGIQGSVVLHAVIGKEGAVEHLDVVSGPDELQASALDAVRQWTYKPFLLNGEPVPVETTITVNFQLND